ncbi:MAG: intein-containing RctB family protein [Methanosarcinaceae archaeon]
MTDGTETTGDFDLTIKIDDNTWEIPMDYKPGMRVPGRIFVSGTLMHNLEKQTLDQVANVATLPGIRKYSMAMPDAHLGYGFPIGGVAAFDREEGVISPGGVGFDINCLSGDTRILHEHGYTVPIKDFDTRWNVDRIKCMNFGTKPRDTEIDAFMEMPTTEKVYCITTGSGETVTASGEHPLYTPGGMVRVKDIQEQKGQTIAIFPFKGVEYETPDSNMIITEHDIRSLGINQNKIDQTIVELKKHNLLPLAADSDKLPYLLKLMGFILGGGTLHFTGNKDTIRFYGKPEDLEDIRLDIERLGFVPSRIYSKTREHEIGTSYAKVNFIQDTYSFKMTSSSFMALMWCLGIKPDIKTQQEYLLPEWIFKLRLWQKRLLLSSLFGAGLSSPATLTGHGYNFYTPVLSMNRHAGSIEHGEEFLDRISMLLADFGIESSRIGKRKEYTDKNGDLSYHLRLQVNGTFDNLIKLWSTVGFEYNQDWRHLANVAVVYLKKKHMVTYGHENTENKALKIKEDGEIISSTCVKLESTSVDRKLIRRSVYGARSNSAKVASNYTTFDHFLSESGIAASGMVWDTITSIEEIEHNDYVYDFMVRSEHHNFVASSFVVSNCGIRLIRTNLQEEDVRPHIKELMSRLFREIPSGVGSKSRIRASESELNDAFTYGSRWAVESGYGVEADIEHCEGSGMIEGADPTQVSAKAYKRGKPQFGTLGSGNHFLEVQYVDKIYDNEVASSFGLEEGQVTIMVHCGSRGAGHQICTDHLRVLSQAFKKYGIDLPDRQLACAPAQSPEAQNYFKAMACGANYAWANRQIITHWTREVFERLFGMDMDDLGMELVYDVAHNVAKLEEHVIDGKKNELYVHRKGATRAFPPGHHDVPNAYRAVGQPVLIPGSMGTASYVLHGTEAAMDISFGSACHGAGRVMSRAHAKREFYGEDIKKDLEARGITVKATHPSVIAEEAPGVYKSSSEVVNVVHNIGIAKKVARVLPMGVAKG